VENDSESTAKGNSSTKIQRSFEGQAVKETVSHRKLKLGILIGNRQNQVYIQGVCNGSARVRVS